MHFLLVFATIKTDVCLHGREPIAFVRQKQQTLADRRDDDERLVLYT